MLSREEVEWLAVSRRLVSPFKARNLGPCSYDLTFGGEYYLYNASDGDAFQTRELAKFPGAPALIVPPNECAFLLTDEIINMPSDLMGQVSLRFGLTKLGIMLSPQAPIDPGYSGRVMMMLYNLSDRPQRFPRGVSFVTIAFHPLSSATSPYVGPNQGVTKIGDFFRPQDESPVRTSIAATERLIQKRSELLTKELENFKRENTRRSTYALTAIAIILAVATLVATVVTIVLTIRTSANDSPAPTTTVTRTVPAPAGSAPSHGAISK